MNSVASSIPDAPVAIRGKSTGHIPSLDGLRGVSILLVLLAHGSGSIPLHGKRLEWIWIFLNNGHLGVITFFVISGYLITYLLRREWEQTGCINLRAFYLRRILRIFPAFYTYIAVIALLVALKLIPHSVTDLWLAATYTWNYRFFTMAWNPTATTFFSEPHSWYCGHLWSLSVEEQFYLLWPPLLWIVGLRKGLKAALLIILLEPFLRVAVHFLIPPLRGSFPSMLPGALDPLMFGAAAALWQGSPNFEQALTRLRNGYVPVAAAIFLLVLSPVLVRCFKGAYELAFEPALQSVSILIILLWLVRRPHTLAGRLFNLPLLAAVGLLSYSLYLWQQMFLVFWHDNLWPVQRFPLNFVCCFAVALTSYHFIEKPFLRLKARFVRIPRPLDTIAVVHETA